MSQEGIAVEKKPGLLLALGNFLVQEVNGNLYVTYAMQNATKHDDFDFPGFGFVDKFSPKGKLLQRLEQGPWRNAPWGVAIAPANFGLATTC